MFLVRFALTLDCLVISITVPATGRTNCAMAVAPGTYIYIFHDLLCFSLCPILYFVHSDLMISCFSLSNFYIFCTFSDLCSVLFMQLP